MAAKYLKRTSFGRGGRRFKSCHSDQTLSQNQDYHRHRLLRTHEDCKERKAAKLRSWRVSLTRKRGQYLGTVEAPNEKAAEAAAVAEFDLSDEQRRRLVVSERD